MRKSRPESQAVDTPAMWEADHRVALAARVVSAYVENNRIQAAELPNLIASVASTLKSLGKSEEDLRAKPAVPIKKSVFDDYVVCLEDGVRLRMLKRYLKTQHGLTPDQYRAKWGLPFDYPMVAPAYARLRSAFAKRIGLGTKATTRKPRNKGS